MAGVDKGWLFDMSKGGVPLVMVSAIVLGVLAVNNRLKHNEFTIEKDQLQRMVEHQQVMGELKSLNQRMDKFDSGAVKVAEFRRWILLFRAMNAETMIGVPDYE